MIEVEVNSIRVGLMNNQRVVLLKDIHSERYLAIWIGQPEADAITLELNEKRPVNRPFTHDLLKNVIENLGGRIVHIFINDMRGEIYYARLVVELENGDQIEIDSRPSDAIALAVRARVGIFVAESVMEKSGIEPDEEVELDAELDDDFEVPEAFEAFNIEDDQPRDVDESQFSAFADFVNSLDLDELDDSDEN